MKHMVTLVLGILLSTAASGLSPVEELPSPVSGPPATLDDMVRAARAIHPEGYVNPTGTSPEILSPITINTAGLNGTFYRTDYFLANFRSVDQEVLIGWIPAGVSGVGQSAQRFNLTANTIYSIPDFLAAGTGRLNKSGVGSILVTGVLAGTNTADPNAYVVGMSRVWTQQPGSTGTTSFASWSPPSDALHGDVQAVIVGLRQNADFRSNYALVNLDPVNSRSWTVNFLSGGSPSTVTLPPLSMQQLAVPSTVPTTSSGYLSIQATPFSTPTTDFRWTFVATTADNVTGDPWISLAYKF
jgi:hypothetical protein